MAVFKCEQFSLCMGRNMPFVVVSSNDCPPFITENNENFERPAKNVFILHGHSGYATDWLYNANLVDLCGKYNINIILPNGENSFYLDLPSNEHKYATYVGKELKDYVCKTFGFSQKREDNFIMGLSMGGFGAIHTGLQFNDTFSKLSGLSSALIIYNIANMKPGTMDGIAGYDYYSMMFGDLTKVVESKNNPETLVLDILKEKKQMPEIYLAIGTEDFLYKENQIFKKFLEDHKVAFEYHEEKGAHDWAFWNKYIEPSIRWFLGLENTYND